MTKRNLYIIGGVAAVLVLLVFHFFTASYWSALGTKAEAKRLIVESLPERTKAEFQNLKAYSSFTVCGEISITNGRGGYTGFEPFIWGKIGGIELKPKVEPGSDDENWQKISLESWQARYSSCRADGQ